MERIGAPLVHVRLIFQRHIGARRDPTALSSQVAGDGQF